MYEKWLSRPSVSAPILPAYGHVGRADIPHFFELVLGHLRPAKGRSIPEIVPPEGDNSLKLGIVSRRPKLYHIIAFVILDRIKCCSVNIDIGVLHHHRGLRLVGAAYLEIRYLVRIGCWLDFGSFTAIVCLTALSGVWSFVVCLAVCALLPGNGIFRAAAFSCLISHKKHNYRDRQHDKRYAYHDRQGLGCFLTHFYTCTILYLSRNLRFFL